MGDGTNWQSGTSEPAKKLKERATEMIDRIPGYRGYRDKEGRRDADRLVRESVSKSFGRLAERSEAVARELANQRRITDVGPVTALTDRIRHLADRIRVAPSGYSPLFSNRVIGESALDQVRLFDEGLMQSVAELETSVAEVEAAAAVGTPLANALQTAVRVVQAGSDRLDKRSSVFDTGTALDEASVVSVLAPISAEPDEAPHASFLLNQGDAVSVLGENAVIDARIDIDAGEQSARLFRMTVGPPARWLFVPKVASVGFATLTELAREASSVATESESRFRGSGEITGTDRASGRQPVDVRITRDSDAGIATIVLDWGSDNQRFSATPVDPADIEMYGPAKVE